MPRPSNETQPPAAHRAHQGHRDPAECARLAGAPPLPAVPARPRAAAGARAASPGAQSLQVAEGRGALRRPPEEAQPRPREQDHLAAAADRKNRNLHLLKTLS